MSRPRNPDAPTGNLEPFAASHTPRKRFGQNFLHDPGIIARIVQAIAPQPGERLVEIGPGEGAITLPLLRAAGALTAIELDRDLIAPLAEKTRALGQLEIINADVLSVDFSALAAGARLRLIGNLPYNISTPILFHALDHAAAIQDMHFMLQKEVVERMAAAPGSKTYGRLSVMLQARCRVQPLFGVPPGAFRPAPKVDSAIVRLVPLPSADLAGIDFSDLERVVRAAFAKRRKTLSNALADVVSADAMRAQGVDPGARAEQLSVAQFVLLANSLG